MSGVGEQRPLSYVSAYFDRNQDYDTRDKKSGSRYGQM
jgi:hypothetical protein